MHLASAAPGKMGANNLAEVTEPGIGKRNPGRLVNGGIKDLLSTWESVRPDLDLSEFLLGIVMNRMGRMLEAAFDRMCRSNFGISGPDMRVLFALRRIGEPHALRPTDLFRAVLVTSGAITKQVDRLQSLGLVERRPDPEYAAGFQVHLTPKGCKVADSATEELVRHSLLGEALKTLPEGIRASGTAFMYQLLEALENAALAEPPAPGK